RRHSWSNRRNRLALPFPLVALCPSLESCMANLLEYVGSVHIYLGPYRGNPIALYLKRSDANCQIGPKVYPWNNVVGTGETPNKAAADFEEKWKAKVLTAAMSPGPSGGGGIKPENPPPPTPPPAATPPPPPAAAGQEGKATPTSTSSSAPAQTSPDPWGQPAGESK